MKGGSLAVPTWVLFQDEQVCIKLIIYLNKGSDRFELRSCIYGTDFLLSIFVIEVLLVGRRG